MYCPFKLLTFLWVRLNHKTSIAEVKPDAVIFYSDCTKIMQQLFPYQHENSKKSIDKHGHVRHGLIGSSWFIIISGCDSLAWRQLPNNNHDVHCVHVWACRYSRSLWRIETLIHIQTNLKHLLLHPENETLIKWKKLYF